MTCFNDDIQGTASVVLAGLFSSLTLSKKASLADHTFLFLGAGEAGIGIADLICSAVVQGSNGSISIEEARKKCWFVDSKGLITDARLSGKIEHHKIPYAHVKPEGCGESIPVSLLDAVKLLHPTALIGVSAQGQTFTQEIVTLMTEYNEHPVIFALSNPTSKSECTAEQAYTWSNGKAVFASGSPFDPFTLASTGQHFVPGQGNNAYIFPGVALGIIVANAMTVNDDDMLIAAKSLAECVTDDRLAVGCCYPDLGEIRAVSKRIAVAVADFIHRTGRSSGFDGQSDIDWSKLCDEAMYIPSY